MENLLFLSFLIPSVSFFKTTFVNKIKIVLLVGKSLGWKEKNEDDIKIFFKFK
jgi:hypothetical protein